MEQTYILLLLFLGANVDFTLTQEDQAVKLDTYEVQIQQLQNKTQDQANKLEKYEVQIQQLQKKSQDDHTLLQEARAELALLQTKMETLNQLQTKMEALEQNQIKMEVLNKLQTKIVALFMCSQLPTEERAFVKDEDRKELYHEGDVIYFSCVPGYTTRSNITYVCTEDGWTATTTGHCRVSCEVLLDPNTVYKYVRLSEDLRSVTPVRTDQSYPDHQDRFTFWSQVLSSSGLRGRCYWEADWTLRGEEVVAVAVSYRRICRGGAQECLFGHNDHSWCLGIKTGRKSSVYYNDMTTDITGRVGRSSGRAGVSSGRVGVSLDWEGGALSFYDVTNGERSHLYTFNTTFTEEVLPGFGLFGKGPSVSVVKMSRD